jgi:DNA-dependent RNA polymerase auxiliary subunit epsilon
MPHNQQLNEGLRPMDLAEMVNDTFEVDTFRSKMGEDRDVCVLTFTVLDRNPAKDLMEFIEKGYDFVLDADVSSGENTNGEYSVFVELSRTKDLAEQIKELTYGIKKLTGISDWEFRYHKDGKKFQVSEETLKSVIPPTPGAYDGLMSKMRVEGIKRFFSKTLMDDLTLDGNVITIHKHFDKKVQLEMIKDGATESILEGIEDGYSVDEAATSEVFWLTKVLGDYTINKIGENFVFNNGSRSMLLKRI